jgi:hypothetical protein
MSQLVAHAASRLWLIEAIGFEGDRIRGVNLMVASADVKSIFCACESSSPLSF